MTKSQQNFLSSIAPAALESERRWGVPAALVMAQAALESAWGKSQLFKLANNPFGIKARAGEPWVEMPTREVVNGIEQRVRAKFRAFRSLEESFLAHGELLSKPRYKRVLEAGDLTAATMAIQNCGYATDPEYAAKLQRVIVSNDLDKPERLLALAGAGIPREMRNASAGVAKENE